MKSDSIFTKFPKDWSFVLETLSPKTQAKINSFVQAEYKSKTIYPQKNDLFSAFELCSFKLVKVIILGQDPYHGEGQAHGLAFSVNKGVKLPPSLRNIYKELSSDLSIEVVEHGDLRAWAKEGVLLLNTVLTVEKGKAGSHRKQGWEEFSSAIIQSISSHKENCVFILWGSPAQKLKQFIDTKKHYVIESVHPSPLSAYRGFFGSKPFSQTNKYLKKVGKTEVNWKL